MTIELPSLPCAYEALGPLISSATLRIHHGKHHRGYVDRVNALIRANFGDNWNSAEAFKAAATGHFGRGWAWLVLDDGVLKIVTTSSADTPVIRGQTPLLVIDVWEHAYCLDHQERRAAYVAGVVDELLNRGSAERNFERATGGPVNDLICVSGHHLGTVEIERALVAHSKAVEATVAGYLHPIKDLGIHVFVALRADAQPSGELHRELEQWVRKKIGPIAVPDRIQWAPTPPKARVGKLVRRILRKIAANDESNLRNTSMLADPAVIGSGQRPPRRGCNR